MIDKVKAGYQPSYWHVFINPAWLTRRALFLVLRRLSESLKGNVLDFGCGRKPYRSLFRNVSEYTGIDTESSGHDHKNSIADVLYDGTTLPFENNEFDGVFSSQVLEHVEDLGFTLRELNRVLRINGKLLISVPFVWSEHEQPYDFRRFTVYGLQSVLNKHGFEVAEVTKTACGPEAIAQMFTLWISQSILRSNKLLIYFFTVFFFSGVHLLGKLVGALLPTDDTFYLDLVVLATKSSDCAETGIDHVE